ncbi:putative adhesin [Streptomyces sp. NPDC050988]|uniref:putative adhesin n=1 Tax=Streptomyces sp. NPDC050988 TaxID=3365637 RepID=UPI003798EB1C
MAGYRPTDWHVLDLEKDPTPGDPDRVKSLAKSLHDFADDVQDALRLVKGMADEDAVLTMVGKTADVFRDEFSGVPKNLKKLKKSYDLAGDALAAYWPQLERAQALADKALAQGREAQADLSSAKSRLSSADSWVTRANKEADKYKDDPGSAGKDVPKPDEAKVRAATRDAQSAKDAHTSAQSDVTTAQNALDAAKKMAADARRMREDAAGDAKRKLDEASDAGIQNRKWYEEVGDWVSDNWDTIVAVCKVVVAVLGIIAMIIGGPILGAIVLIAALVVLADTLNKYMKGQASLWEVAFAALDCIPGMKGLTTLGGLAKGLKGGMSALKGLRGGLKGMSAAVRGLGRSARGTIADGAKGAYNRLRNVVRSKGSDPVDMATGAMYLPQTDVELPGVLPLSFSRRVASDYRCGWWFGPTWASTIDQRLEIDAYGVVFVTEDGLLLAYPHPTDPETAVLPEAGPRRPMFRLEDGSYRVDDPLTGHARHFALPIDGTALITRIVDRNANSITVDHDEHGTPLAIRHSSGHHLKLATAEGRVTALSLAGAAEDGSDVTVKRYGYTDGSLTETVNSSGLPLKFTYDERLRITSWTDTNNSRYAYTYDDRDRCIAEGGEAGHITIALDYDGTDPEWPDCSVTTLTTSEGAVTRFVVNGNSQVIAETDPLGAVTRTEYDEHHHVLTQTDALGHSTRFVNNENGQPTVISRPDGRETRAEYNDLRLPITLVGYDGRVHTRAYDERGNRTAVTDPTGGTTRFTYDEGGRLTSATDPLGCTSTVRSDRSGLPVEITDALGSVTRYERDAFGRPKAITDPTGAVTWLEWTVEGQLARRTAQDGTSESWTYDGEGNCTSHTNPMGAVSRFEYTHFDLLTARTGPDGVRYEFDHDTELRLTKVTNPHGLTWTYEYDAAGNLLSENDFDDRTFTYGHDAAGRVTSRTNALGQLVTFERNTSGRVTRKDAAGQVTTYAYDLADHLVRATNPDASVALLWDRFGRLCSETVNDREVTYTYDELGRRTGRTTPSGATSTWAYDAVGNRTGLVSSGRQVDFAYDSAGRELSRRMGEAFALTHTYDPLGRVTTQSTTTSGGRPIQHRAYTYRVDGNLLGIEDQFSGSRRFDLDTAGRVTAVHAANWTETYAYDETGNQTSASWPASHAGQEAVGERIYEGTRVVRAGQVRYEHDDLGRIVLRQKTRLSRKPDTWRYQWDAEDRLVSVITPDGTRWRYTYDPLGRRTAKIRLAGDGETVVERVDFTWDGTTLCEQTTTAPSLPRPVILTWEHQGLRPIAQTERVTAAEAPQEEIDSRFFAIVTDLVGTPSELVDEQGRIAWRTRSTVWGTPAWSADSTTSTPLRFPGQYFDPETELHYNCFRHYDPETARYLTSDPLGLAPALNPVGYVLNPHAWADPLGLSPCPVGETTRAAPNFVAGSGDGIVDVRQMGRPDNQLVLSGHGGIRAGDGTSVTVPEGTSVSMYSRHGEPISDALGNRIETGNPSALEVYGPGEQLPDYSLFPPDGLNILGTPRNVTATGETPLSELLRPNMGSVHWAACRSVI